MSVPTDPAAELHAPPTSISLLRHAAGARFLYAIVVPLAALNMLVNLYQAVCFRQRVPRVARRGHFKMDRHKLTYLTPLTVTSSPMATSMRSRSVDGCCGRVSLHKRSETAWSIARPTPDDGGARAFAQRTRRPWLCRR